MSNTYKPFFNIIDPHGDILMVGSNNDRFRPDDLYFKSIIDGEEVTGVIISKEQAMTLVTAIINHYGDEE